MYFLHCGVVPQGGVYHSHTHTHTGKHYEYDYGTEHAHDAQHHFGTEDPWTSRTCAPPRRGTPDVSGGVASRGVSGGGKGVRNTR